MAIFTAASGSALVRLRLCTSPSPGYGVVVAPAGDLLSTGSPRGSDACHTTEVAYTPSDFIGRPQRRIGVSLNGQRTTAPLAKPNLVGWMLGAGRCFSQQRQALCLLRLLRTGSVPRSVLIKRTPNKHGRCRSDV